MLETQEMWVRSLGQEDPLEKEMATHSSILVWEIPWTEESGRIQSMGLQRVRHDWTTFTFQGLLMLFYLSSFPLVICQPSVSLKCAYFVILVAKLCLTLWLLLVARQAPQSMGFPRQEYWNGLPFSSPRDLPDPRIEPTSLVSPALAGEFFTTSVIRESESHSVVSDCLMKLLQFITSIYWMWL